VTVADANQGEVVEAIFPLEGQALPRDHAQALQHALAERLPWLRSDVGAGIHPLKLVFGPESLALLSQRTRLILRVNASRLDSLTALAGVQLDVAGHPLRLGLAHLRALQPHATLYAYRVAAINAEESLFMQAIEAELAVGLWKASKHGGRRAGNDHLQHDAAWAWCRAVVAPAAAGTGATPVIGLRTVCTPQVSSCSG